MHGKNGTVRYLSNKTIWNRTCRLSHDKIKEVKKETFKSYLKNLFATKDIDYLLWKATKQIKKPRAYVPPIHKDHWQAMTKTKLKFTHVI